MKIFHSKKKSFRFIKVIVAVLFIVPLIVASAESPTTKTSEDVFKRWITTQRIRNDVNLNDLQKNVDNEFIKNFVEEIPKEMSNQLAFIFPRTMSYKKMTRKERALVRKKIIEVQSFMENNIQGLVDYLIKNKFTSFEISMLEEWDINNENTSMLYLKYRRFFEALLHESDYSERYSIFNSAANRFFEYCFYPQTFDHFKEVVSSKENYPLVRFLYEIIWYYLARGEWISWHQNTLDNLKKEHALGKEIVYIAGGNDIFQLISNGIYNIRNIDPIYPTQTRYYSEGWDFLAKGSNSMKGVGDRIIFDDPAKKGDKITMHRVSYKEFGIITEIDVNGKKVKIPRSETVWEIKNKKGEKLGRYILERRFVEQNDFKYDPKKALLISFNELYFIMTTCDENWGINPKKFDKKININVKQLRAPLNHKVLMNIRTIQESDFPNRFGSSVIGD